MDAESLDAIEIRDDELRPLLERLAATDAAFQTPVTTIRDVAELTETSPKTIARILADIRAPGEVERLDARIDIHEKRIQSVEQTSDTLKRTVDSLRYSMDVPAYIMESKQEPVNSRESYEAWLREDLIATPQERDFLKTFIFGTIAVIVCLVLIGISYSNS